MKVVTSGGDERIIRIEVEGDDAFAYDGGDQVGEVTTTGEDDLGHGQLTPPTITYMHVDEDYRRNGIGMALIRALFEDYGQLAPAQRDIGIGGINALTDEGENLTRRAQAEGLICPFPEEKLDEDEDRDE
jgi:GNAT superfamily N-acetyltransferase